MTRFGWPLALLLPLVGVPSALAQPGPGGRDAAEGRSRLPAVGTNLPDVAAYDEQGNEFSTRSLRGQYSVLVFGCLT